ncbi:uncharacterized protein IL334_002280 [Kwoniella shivajii]|uniref:Pentatricopeptide repeat protein n=1 Tax=Kwoniella shivajii TaxID=564305 RepID=A0ABZ1CYD8_9TREE|nr:hypothetical protein IL334_002280 [Kwoniella shivajii]
MLTKATAHIRPFIRLPSSSGASPDHFTANPSLLHHLPHNGAGNSLVASGPNPTQTAGSSGSAGRHGYGGNAGAGSGGGYTGHARAFLSLPQTTSVDPSSTMSNSDEDSFQNASSSKGPSLLLKHRLSKRTRIIGPSDGVGREVRREIEARAGGSKVSVMEIENNEETERPERLALSSSRPSRRRSSIAFPSQTTFEAPSSSSSSSSRTPLRPATSNRQQRAGLTRSPSAVEIWQVGIPHPRAPLGLRSLSTRSDIPKSLEAEDVQPFVSTSSVPATRILGQPNRVLMDLAGRDLPGKSLGMVRRNSTAAVERSSLDQPPIELLLQNTDKTRSIGPDAEPQEKAIYDAIITARRAEDLNLLQRLIQHYRSPRSVSPFSEDEQPGDPTLIHQFPLPSKYSLRNYNAILSALVGTRQAGQSIASILEIYNEILERDLIPNATTYGFVIRALSLRSVEVSHAVQTWEQQKSWGEWRARQLGPATWDYNSAAEKDQLFQSYEAEGNLPSALKLFRAATRINSTVGFPLPLYGTILDAMSRESKINTQAMLQIFRMAQRFEVPGSISLYKHMFRALGETKDAEQLNKTWNELIKASHDDKVESDWLESNPGLKGTDSEAIAVRVRGLRQEVWHSAIKAFIAAGQIPKALEIFGEMMDSATSSSTSTTDYKRAPPATHRTCGQLVVDLAETGNLDLALEWSNKVHTSDYLGKLHPPRLALEHITYFVDALIKADKIELAKKVMEKHTSDYGQFTTASSRTTIGRRTWRILTALVVRASEASEPERDQILDTIKDFSKSGTMNFDVLLIQKHIGLLAKSKRWEDMASVLEACTVTNTVRKENRARLAETISALATTDIPLKHLLALIRQASNHGIEIKDGLASAIINKYSSEISKASSAQDLDLSNLQWSALIESFAALPSDILKDREYDDAFLSLVAGLGEISKEDGFLNNLSVHVAVRTVINSLIYRFGLERSKHLLIPVFGEEKAEEMVKIVPQADNATSFSPSASASPNSSEFTLPSTPSSATTASQSQPEIRLSIDRQLSASVERFTHKNPPITPLDAYDLVRQGLTRNSVPYPGALCHLIDHLARAGDEPKVRELYQLCQVLLSNITRPETQANYWHQVEDAMLIANCHLGYLEQAGMHRARIVESGMAPSADAYATMIASSKDTTDDALVARELFDESQMMGVKPHLYLYNTIISKLSKARKAETALELFKHMKEQGIRPSSVTYGAVINACCRVGDAQSAETLFEEMASQPNFRARVPPFNTMMQFYLQTQPNRSRVLHYYSALQRANVPPSAHTYKLLLDTYATLAPIDLESMERVFAEIQSNRNVQVQGTHWASLITAYGLHGGDLEKSKAIFESINERQIKEAVIWEAMLNVLSQRGTLSELEAIKEKMLNSGVQPTAYVYNALINGYSRSGEIEKAREVFESMGDSITGVAAPNNHPTLLTSSGHIKPNTITNQPSHIVYREPSTYETMIRAEIKSDNKVKAEQVLAKMEERGYPLAVFMRGRAALEDSQIGQ